MDEEVEGQVSGNGVRADDGDAIGRYQGLWVICRASGSRRLEDAAALAWTCSSCICWKRKESHGHCCFTR